MKQKGCKSFLSCDLLQFCKKKFKKEYVNKKSLSLKKKTAKNDRNSKNPPKFTTTWKGV